jgi:ParB family transcriptional regulator, chromosome partitioning protein
MKRSGKISTIPISAITVLSSRERSQAAFKELVTSIANLGLKKPITVSNRTRPGPYELVCGEGRIEAFAVLGQKEIPAIVVDAPTEDCLLMSLIENIARRRHSPLELLGEIGRLAKHYGTNEIAAKLDLRPEYVRAVCYLLKHGEERLLSAVERGVVPPTLAIEMAKAKSPKLQGALLETYVSERHTSKQIATMRRLVEQRHRQAEKARRKHEQISPAGLVRAYREETDRQKLVVRKADLAQARLLFIVNALRTLLSERMFVTLLRGESLDKLPLPILRRITSLPAGLT